MDPQAQPTATSTKWFRAASITLLILTGLYSLLWQIVTPSFWYVPCAVFLTLSACFWWRPLRGSSASLPFILVLLLELATARLWTWPGGRGILYTAGPLLLLSLALVLFTFRQHRQVSIPWLSGSIALVLLSFAVDRRFTSQIEVERYTANWTASSHLPWGEAHLGEHGEIPVTLYTSGPHGYCYHSIYDPQLKAALKASGTPKTQVTFNHIFNFGKSSGYKLGSVAGIVYNDGNRRVRSEIAEGGFIMIDDAPETDWCKD